MINTPNTRKSCAYKFDYRTNLVCGTVVKVNHGKRGTDVYFIRTLPILLSVKAVCKSRNDEWGNEVLGPIEYMPKIFLLLKLGTIKHVAQILDLDTTFQINTHRSQLKARR